VWSQLPVKGKVLERVVKLPLGCGTGVFQTRALGTQRPEAVFLLLELPDVA
jgi:hypothetical protein